MNLPRIQYVRWLELLWYHTRILQLKPDRLPLIVFKLDRQLVYKTWIDDVTKIAKTLQILPQEAGVHSDMKVAEKELDSKMDAL